MSDAKPGRQYVVLFFEQSYYKRTLFNTLQQINVVQSYISSTVRTMISLSRAHNLTKNILYTQKLNAVIVPKNQKGYLIGSLV